MLWCLQLSGGLDNFTICTTSISVGKEFSIGYRRDLGWEDAQIPKEALFPQVFCTSLGYLWWNF